MNIRNNRENAKHWWNEQVPQIDKLYLVNKYLASDDTNITIDQIRDIYIKEKLLISRGKASDRNEHIANNEPLDIWEEVSIHLKFFCVQEDFIGKPLQTVMPQILEELKQNFTISKIKPFQVDAQQSLEFIFRSFIRTNQLTSKWEEFIKDNHLSENLTALEPDEFA